jgi:FkbM family methyltransferase
MDKSKPAVTLNASRKVAFVIAATDHGPLIVNRFDRNETASGIGYGVGFELLEKTSYHPDEIGMAVTLLDLRRKCYGDGVVAIDGGANIGVYTVEWARHMRGWGFVLAIEAQERIYYALAGNIAINNCANARAIHAALSRRSGSMKMPVPDYFATASFGSLELRKHERTEFIGQAIEYSESHMVDVRTVSLDSCNIERLDLVKLDIEGMELDALAGGIEQIARFHPALIIETIKTDKKALYAWLENLGYLALESGVNLVAVHHSDRCLAEMKMNK